MHQMWLQAHKFSQIGLKNYKNLTRWYELISKRDAVRKGYDIFEKSEKIPKV